jgi:hypothetical protein
LIDINRWSSLCSAVNPIISVWFLIRIGSSCPDFVGSKSFLL